MNINAKFIKELIFDIIIILVLLIIIREFVFELRYIPSESMEPSLKIDDKLLVEKFSKRFRGELARGDILIFYPPKKATDGKEILKYDPFNWFARATGLPFLPQPEAYIKRLIALPGDDVEVRKGVGVYVNDEFLHELYLEGSPFYLPEYNLSKRTVPENSYFVLGDNRNYSYDSHVWGFLPKKRVIGRAAFMIYRALDEKPKLPDELDELEEEDESWNLEMIKQFYQK